MNKNRKIAIGTAIAVLAIYFITTFSLGSVINSEVEQVSSEILGTDVTVHGGHVSLLAGSGGVGSIEISNPQGFDGDYAMRITDIDSDVALSSIFSDPLEVNYILVHEIDVEYRIGSSGSNIDKLMNSIENHTSDDEGRDVHITYFALDETDINLGIDFEDVDEELLRFTLTDIQITNIGKEENVKLETAMKLIFMHVFDEVESQIRDQLIEAGSEAVQEEIEDYLDEMF